MKEVFLAGFGFVAGALMIIFFHGDYIDKLKRDNELLEQSRNFWMGESLKTPAQQVDSIQRTLDAIEKQIVGESGDCA